MTRPTFALLLLALCVAPAVAQPGATFHDDGVRFQRGEAPRDLTQPTAPRGPGARAHRRAVDQQRAAGQRLRSRPVDRRVRVAPAPGMVPPTSIRQGPAGFAW